MLPRGCGPALVFDVVVRLCILEFRQGTGRVVEEGQDILTKNSVKRQTLAMFKVKNIVPVTSLGSIFIGRSRLKFVNETGS